MMYVDVLLRLILQQYFASTRCIFTISDRTSAKIDLPLGFSIVSATVDFSENSTVLWEKLFRNYGCSVFVFSVQNPGLAVSVVEKGIKLQNETFYNRTYIFIHNFGSALESQLSKNNEMKFVYNFLVIALQSQEVVYDYTNFGKYEEVYSLWTQKYTEFGRNIQFYLLDKWFSINESFLLLKNPFPNKLVYGFGKVYKVGFFPYLPYIYYELNEKEEIVLKGVEGTVIKEFFQKENLSMSPYLVVKDYWGDIFDNGSVYGLRGVIYQDKVDVGVAAHFPTDRMYRYFGITIPLWRVGITCLVPAPKLAAAWLTPLHAYSKWLWKMIIVGYIFIVLSISVIQFVTQFKIFLYPGADRYIMHCRQIGGILFAIVTHRFGSITFLYGYSGTLFILVTLFVTFFLNRTYESGLSTIMTIPRYEDSIETANDFFKSNISWGGIQVADWIMHWETDEQEDYRRAYKRYLAAPSESKLKKLLAAGNFGLLIERISSDHFHFPFPSLEKSRKIKLMKEDIHWEFTVFLLRKSSALIPLLNKFISELHQAGLVEYWLDQAAAEVLPIREQRQVKYLSQHYTATDEKVVRLELVDVVGIFGIVVIGNFMAFVVFIVEIIYNLKYSLKMY